VQVSLALRWEQEGERHLAASERKAEEGVGGQEELLFMNDRARLLRIKIAPGGRSGRHSHPNHLMYVLKPSRMRVKMPNGDIQEYKGKAGDSVWLEAGDYEAENIGDKPFEAVLFEIR